jgi:hypothetical protein
MSTFARKFPIELISDQVLGKNPWFKDMLLHWRPPDDAMHRDLSAAQKVISKGRILDEDPKRFRMSTVARAVARVTSP